MTWKKIEVLQIQNSFTQLGTEDDRSEVWEVVTQLYIQILWLKARCRQTEHCRDQEKEDGPRYGKKCGLEKFKFRLKVNYIRRKCTN